MLISTRSFIDRGKAEYFVTQQVTKLLFLFGSSLFWIINARPQFQH